MQNRSVHGVSPDEYLPTMDAGSALLRGDFAQIVPVTGLFFWRAAAIALGMLASGERDKYRILRNSLWGSAGVQAFVFGYALLHGAKDDVPLPSATSASAVVDGNVKAIPVMLAHWVARSAILGGGVYLGGERRDFKTLAKISLFGGAAIEASILIYLWQQKRQARAAAAAAAPAKNPPIWV